MKRLRTFEPFPALFLLMQLLQERQLASLHRQIPCTRGLRYWMDSVNRNSWPACQATCSRGGIEPWRGVEFNFLSHSLYTAFQHLSNLSHLEKLSLYLAEKGNNGAGCVSPSPYQIDTENSQ